MSINNKWILLLCVVIVGAMLVSCSSKTAPLTNADTVTGSEVGANTPASTSDNTNADLQLVTADDTDIGEMI